VDCVDLRFYFFFRVELVRWEQNGFGILQQTLESEHFDELFWYICRLDFAEISIRIADAFEASIN